MHAERVVLRRPRGLSDAGGRKLADRLQLEQPQRVRCVGATTRDSLDKIPGQLADKRRRGGPAAGTLPRLARRRRREGRRTQSGPSKQRRRTLHVICSLRQRRLCRVPPKAHGQQELDGHLLSGAHLHSRRDLFRILAVLI